MLKLGSKGKGIGTPVACPACRYPNLGIDIWCERCGTPLDWNRPSPGRVSAPPAPSPVVAPEAPDPSALHPIAPSLRQVRTTPAFTLPRLTMPALAWPRLRMPRSTVPQLKVPRVPRIVWVGAAVLAVLLIVLLAEVLHLPATNGAAAGGTPQAAAIPGVEAKTGLQYRTGTCLTNVACLRVASQTVGQDAAAVVFSTASTAGRQCVGYVYRTGGRWHFLNAVCGPPDQLSPLVAHDATIHVPSNCANVRSGPSLKAGVVACLHDGTTVHIDGGPTYADSRLWWHQKQGWMAQDFLTGR